jgi:oxygen-independent coproporphyrinogen III oxidase
VRKRLGQVAAADESLELQMFHHTRNRLAQIGRPAYEISNYAIPGEECRHNLLYWNGGNYLGLGPSAASHADGWRWRNRPHLGEWESCVQAGELPAAEIEHLSPPHRARELAMLQLRLAGGLRYADFSDRSGYDAREIFSEQIARLSALGLLRANADGIALGDRGLEVADTIAGEFLAAGA